MTETTSARKAFRAQPVLLVATSNPKKAGSMSYDRFEGYFDIDWSEDQTVGSVLDGRNVRMDDIMHDKGKGFIIVGQDAIDDYYAQAMVDHIDAIEAARELLDA
jgi:hypothetical protein